MVMIYTSVECENDCENFTIEHFGRGRSVR